MVFFVSVPGPEVTVNDGISSEVAVEGERFTTACNATFIPGLSLEDIQITWEDGQGVEITGTPSFIIIVGPVEQGGPNSFGRQLSVPSLDINYAGVYVCIATAANNFLNATATTAQFILDVIPQCESLFVPNFVISLEYMHVFYCTIVQVQLTSVGCFQGYLHVLWYR